MSIRRELRTHSVVIMNRLNVQEFDLALPSKFDEMQRRTFMQYGYANDPSTNVEP